MKNAKGLFLWVILILAIGMIGCSSGSSSGSSTTTTTTTTTTTSTDPLVGTWKCDKGAALGQTLVFNANKTGVANGSSGFNNWNLNGNLLTFNLDSGASERFQVDFDNANKNSFTFTNLNPATPDVAHYVKQ